MPALYAAAREKRLIVAHRGAFGGNIPCNTLPAFEAALAQGADVLELDADLTADGLPVVFHPGMEARFLGADTPVAQMTWAQAAQCRYRNFDGAATQFGLETLDAVLETFRGRCLLYVDKFFGHPEAFARAIARHGMNDQVLVSGYPDEDTLGALEAFGPKLPFLAVVWNEHPLHGQLLRNGLNYVGSEVLFRTEGAEVATRAFTDRMHADGRVVLVNAIGCRPGMPMAAEHSDDAALCGDPEFGWGWLARRGFDLIQTDWPGMLHAYLENAGLRHR